MSILQEIHTWSQGLPNWQQDAVARIYTNRELSIDDYDDLFALAKTEYGIADPAQRKPQKLAAAQVAAQPIPNRIVQLAAIKQLANVNAIADGTALPMNPSGLTIIYGENGAGKSGYSRVLKHACRARDQSESILPDAKKDPSKTGSAEAIFETIINGQKVDLPWKNGAASPEELSELSIFDSHCARAYIDNQGDFAYVPYGLDILAGLVRVCSTIKDLATKEKTAHAPNITAFAVLAKNETSVGKALAEIPSATKATEIEALAKLTDVETQRLVELNKILAETDPKQKALAQRQKATRLTNLSTRVGTAIDLVSDAKLKELRELIDASNVAKGAAELAAQDFKNMPDQLPGTGGEEWKTLFDAARSYSAISHLGHEFPNLPADSTCPLCQNELHEAGVQRFVRFDTFIQQATEKAAKDAKDKAITPYRNLEQAMLDLSIDEALAQELTEVSEGLATASTALQASLYERKINTIKAAGGQFDWDQIQPISEDPRSSLTDEVKRLQASAKSLEDSIDEKAKAAMVSEQAELVARQNLNEVKSSVLEAIEKYEHCAKLQACIDSLSTTLISRKSTELSKTMATQEVADALNVELKKLNVHELQVIMKPESPGGKTQFKLALQLPGGGSASAILSEGEQRAIAIASFLTEIKLGKGLGGIVFDDPVSSLDHRRRWDVAERLVLEAQQRQVIIFTHDIYFLCVIQQKAEEFGAALMTQYIRRTSAGFGVHTSSLPFDILNTKARIGSLRQMHVEVQRAHKNGDDDETKRLTRETYRHLRLAWERSVEEVLFDGVVQRFGEGISTQKLKRVTVEDDDYAEIDAGMTKSSKFEHDAAATIHLPTPHPDDVKNDIERLETWRTKVEARKLATANARK